MHRRDALELRVQRGLEGARDARLAGDEAARRAALEDAVHAAAALEDPTLLAGTCWRLAKARHDAGLAAELVDALVPMMDEGLRERGVWGVRQDVRPFERYAAGLRAWPVIARTVGDHLGYGDGRVDALWAAWIDRQRAVGDAYGVAWGRIQRSWAWACTGRVDEVATVNADTTRLHPRDLADAPSHHPRAKDPDDNVSWLQLDAARTLLRAATWARDARRADEARDDLLDLAEALGPAVSRDPWWLDSLCRAAETFGWDDVLDRHGADYAALSTERGLEGPHRQRARAFADRRHGDGTAAAREAAAALAEAKAGPEWVVEAWVEAGDHQAAAEEARRTGVVHHAVVRRA